MTRHFVCVRKDGSIIERMESDIYDAMERQPDIPGVPQELQIQVFGISDMPVLPCLATRINLAIAQAIGVA